MVAIFTGLGAGFERGSAAALGAGGLLGSGRLGRGGENVAVNAATGNLVLSRQDEFLIGRGPDAAVARTYNSLGALDDNDDYWRQSTDRRVYGLTGTVNTTGSTIKRVSADGAEITYAWAGSYYETTDGAGSHDRLTYNSGIQKWTWADGDTDIAEVYALASAGNWRIESQSDSDGNALTFTYTSDKLTRITTQDGSYIQYTWTGSNITRVESWINATTSYSNTVYGYDGSNRLTSVTVDLTPSNLSDSVTYVTSYTYDGVSKRVASITQTDGSVLSITYHTTGTFTGWVKDLTQTVGSGDTRVTSFAYTDEGGGLLRTEITDPRGQVTKLWSKNADNGGTATDERGQLMRVMAPPASTGATPTEINYTYDANGNVLTAVTKSGSITLSTVSYQYDAAGNVTQITDANGNVVTRQYAATTNKLLMETRTGSHAGGSGSLYTRYVYDAEEHLTFVVGAEGHVTEYAYTAGGEVQYVFEYPGDAYAIGSTLPTNAQMASWRAGLDRTTSKILQNDYDARGNLIATTRYGASDASGAALTSEGVSTTYFSYDAGGRLLSKYNSAGSSGVAETYAYDGLGRVLVSVDRAGGRTTAVFNDAATTTTVTTQTASNGAETGQSYVVVSTYNKAGELISVVDSGSATGNSFTAGGTTTSVYDKNGLLRLTTDPTGLRNFYLYDKSGRKVADIRSNNSGSATGEIVEYRYDASGRVVAIARYANKLTTAQLSTLADPANEVDIDTIRPSAHGYDIWEWSIYDVGGRVIETILGDGSVSGYEYDASNRLIKTISYVNKLSSGTITGYRTTSPTVVAWPTANANDTVTRAFFDRDGRLLGALDAEGYLSQVIYDEAGQKVREIAYANATSTTYRASGTFDQLLGSVTLDAARDVSSRYVYDGQGLLRYTIDGINRVTELTYYTSTAGMAVGLARKTVAYAAALGSVANYTYATIKVAVGALASAQNDRTSWSVYNDRGQLKYAVSQIRSDHVSGVYRPIGTVIRYDYDAAGLVTKTTQYASTIDMHGVAFETPAALDTWASSNSANARITRNYYSERGELGFTVDAEGYVNQLTYWTNGLVRYNYRYSAAISVDDTSTISTVNSANKGTSVVTETRYDASGRKSDFYDANGVRYYFGYHATGQQSYLIRAYAQGADESRIHYVYDQAGRLIREINYTSEVGNASVIGTSAVQVNGANRLRSASVAYNAVVTREGEVRVYHNGEMIWSNGVREVVSGATYRLVAQTDGNLVVYRDVSGQSAVAIWSTATSGSYSGATFLIMQDNGNLEFHKGTPGSSLGVIWSSGTTGVTASSHATEWVDTNYTYDGLGNVLTTTDSKGQVTTSTYDKAGRLLTASKGGIQTSYEYDAFGRGVKVTDPRGNASFSYYDQLGRVVLTIDAENYAVRTAYSAFGEIDTVTRYYTKVSGTLSVATQPTTPTHAADAATTFIYDKLGRLTRSTDALGNYEEYTLDAHGERTAVRNKLAGVTTNTYDKLGRLVQEQLPVSSYYANGTLQAANVINKYTYDSRGNQTQMIEAFGLAEQRITNHEYDTGNRLTRTYGQSTQILTSSTASLTSIVPQETFIYDRRGNVVETVDAVGARTLFWYDKLDRVVAQLSATGTLTRLFYDKNSNTAETRVYETAVALPADAKGMPPAGSGAYRVTLYTYDALNRLTETRVPSIATATYSGGTLTVTTQDLVTTSVYDGAGNVVKTIDANGKATWYYYDKAGNRTVMIDAENYRTDWAHDADGNVLTERRYSTASAAPSSTTAPPTAPSTTADDRVTTFTYDKMGRRLTETRSSVHVHDGSGAHITQNSTITYSYNGLGQVAQKTEGVGQSVNYTYDTGGRLITEARAAFTDFNGQSVTPMVDYYYNGLDELSRARQRGSSGVISVDERVTTYTYGTGGRLATMTDPNGLVRTYRYDAAGRVMREEYLRDPALGTEGIGYAYDLEGRLTQQSALYTPGPNWSSAGFDVVTTQYNAFGEVAARGLNGILAETFAYDAAGRMWRTTAGDGTWKYFMYDRAGNQTLAIASDGTDISSQSMTWVLDRWGSNRAHIATNYVDGVVATITSYDGRNMTIEVREPQRELNLTTKQNLTTTRAYNAFGETAHEINAAGARVDYTYNTMGRLIKTESPTVSVTSESGAVSNVRPTEHRYYDLSGRLVASRDANGNLTRLTLLAGTGFGGTQALTAVVTTADSATVTTAFDIHGDARKITDQISRITTQTFDRMGRLTQVSRPGGLTETLEYDGFGQLLRRYNNLLGSGVVETSLYDGQGRLIQQVAMGGDTTSFSYTWSGSLATAGLGTFGGWTKVTTYANSKTLSEQTDQFGRAISKTDLGGNVSSSTYDKAGRVVVQTGGDDLNYTYLNTGRLATMSALHGSMSSDDWDLKTQTYGYDAVGNLVSQRYDQDGEASFYTPEYWVWVGGGPQPELPPFMDPENPEYGWEYHPAESGVTTIDAVLENATATYDALGRLTGWYEAGSANVPAASTTYNYDAQGNIRHTSSSFHTLNSFGNPSASPVTKDLWYRFDALNRVVTSEGVFQGTAGSGSIVRGSQGMDITYDLAGQRAYSLRTDTSSVITREDYAYDADGRLTEVRSGSSASTPGVIVGRYGYDTMGRLAWQKDYTGGGYQGSESGTNLVYHRTNTWNAKSQISVDTTITKRGSNTYQATSTYGYGSGSGYALGSPLTVTTQNWANGSAQANSETTTSYAWYDGAVTSSVTYKQNAGQGSTQSTPYTYAVIGGRAQLAKVDIPSVPGLAAQAVNYRNTLTGEILWRWNGNGGGAPSEFFYRFGGKEMGHISNNGTRETSYTASVTDRTAVQGTGLFHNGATSGTSSAAFAEGVDPVTTYAQGSSHGGYTVRGVETLESIASTVWGDSALWFKLAEANGLTGQSALFAGQQLVIPAGVMRSTHNASTFKPYDPTEAMGELGPARPPQPNKKNCGAMGQIIMVAIAVAVAAVVAPWALGTAATTTVVGGVTVPVAATGLTGALGVTGGAIASGAIAGAAGSAASQVAGIAMGMQEKFSWNAVGMAALGGAIGGSGKLGIGGGSWEAAAGRAMIGSIVSQGVGVATGMQDKFSWAGVAAAGVGAAAMSGIGIDGLANHFGGGDVGAFLAHGVSGGASAIANAATRSLIEGSDFGDNVIAALPDVIGQAIGSMITDRLSGTTEARDAAFGQMEVQRGGASNRSAETYPKSPSQESDNEISNSYSGPYVPEEQPPNIDDVVVITPKSLDQEINEITKNSFTDLSGWDVLLMLSDHNAEELMRQATEGLRKDWIRRQITPNGSVFRIEGLSLNLADYKLAVEMGLIENLKAVPPKGFNSDKQVQAVGKEVQSDLEAAQQAGKVKSGIWADDDVRQFVAQIAEITANAKSGLPSKTSDGKSIKSEQYERYLAFGRNEKGEVVVTAIGLADSQGGYTEIPSGSIAMAHVHWGNLSPKPGAGDSDSLQYGYSNFVIGQKGKSLWEVGLVDGKPKQRKINVNTYQPGGWQKFGS
jgi:YD repeat-containing protein